jgi:hypothetical protein
MKQGFGGFGSFGGFGKPGNRARNDKTKRPCGRSKRYKVFPGWSSCPLVFIIP